MKWLTWIFLIWCSFLLLSDPVSAQDDPGDLSVHFSTVSYHINPDRDYNEVNPGIGLELQLTDRFSPTIGGYYNSVDELSIYIGTAYNVFVLGPAEFELFLGLISGYDYIDEIEVLGFMPSALLSSSVKVTEDWFGRLIFFPPIGDTGLLALQIGYNLN